MTMSIPPQISVRRIIKINADSAIPYLAEYSRILNNMINNMTGVETTDSISHNFIVRMIPHHQAAIEMSENVLKFTTNVKLTEMWRNAHGHYAVIYNFNIVIYTEITSTPQIYSNFLLCGMVKD